MLNTKCKICNSISVYNFTAKILNKYSVKYFQCSNCQFLQTEKVFWLNEAYKDAITKQDIGLLYRNRKITPILKSLIKVFFNKKNKFIDYGAGYGVLVRIMRDYGYDMYRFDKYCSNIFADGYDCDEKSRYELLTAFEVFEHLDDPIKEVESMLNFSDNIFFSTEIQPLENALPGKWWYIMPETGQHIALYSIKSLNKIALNYNLNYYTNGKNLHLFTKKKINSNIFKLLMRYKLSIVFDNILADPKSLLLKDYNSIM